MAWLVTISNYSSLTFVQLAPPPPPPGPPPPKPPVKPPSGVQWTKELAGFSAEKLNKMAKKDVQKDGLEAAKQMLGKNRRKLILNELY